MKTSQDAGLLRSKLAEMSCDTYRIDSIQPQKRVIPASRNRHVRGWHPVRPGHGPIPFESKLESRVISALAEFVELVAICSQPITVSYLHEGRVVRYTPDFYIELSSVPVVLAELGFCLRTYVEVKPLARAAAAEEVLKRQFAVVRQGAQAAVTLVTEVDLEITFQEIRHVG